MFTNSSTGSRDAVTGVSAEEYFKDKVAAPRPATSTLALDKLRDSGFTPAPAAERLSDYLNQRTEP